MTTTDAVTYVEAIGRNEGEDKQHSHLYEITRKIDPKTGQGYNQYLPMCRHGWNRSDGESFSIFRGHRGDKGLCKTCERRRKQGLPGVESKPNSHKTKWL